MPGAFVFLPCCRFGIGLIDCRGVLDECAVGDVAGAIAIEIFADFVFGVVEGVPRGEVFVIDGAIHVDVFAAAGDAGEGIADDDLLPRDCRNGGPRSFDEGQVAKQEIRGEGEGVGRREGEWFLGVADGEGAATGEVCGDLLLTGPAAEAAEIAGVETLDGKEDGAGSPGEALAVADAGILAGFGAAFHSGVFAGGVVTE